MSGLSNLTKSRGQAAVFVLLFLGVLVLSLIFVFKAGKVTTQRMMLQNAADASAYTVSTVEARDLNFISYTNRAMIANEVAIGQMVGLSSWVFNWGSFAPYLNGYRLYFLDPLVSAVSLGTATVPFQNAFRTIVNTLFYTTANAVTTFLSPIVDIVTRYLVVVNKIFSAVQTGFHFTTILYALSAMLPDLITGESVINQNAPGATISDFGVLALFAHTLTYASYPGAPSLNLPIPNAPTEAWFTRTYQASSNKDTDMGGFQRFAAITNASKDDFSRKRGWELPMPLIPEGAIDYTGPDRFEADLAIATVWFEFELVFELTLAKQGGSELRYKSTASSGSTTKKCPAGYEPGKASDPAVKNNPNKKVVGGTTCVPAAPGPGVTPDPEPGTKYSWSAGDGTGLFVYFKMHVAAGADVLGGTISASMDMKLKDGNASGKLSLDLGVLGDIDIFDLTFPFPTSAPFSSGSAQAAKGSNKLLTNDLALVNTNAYGGAPANRSAWVLGVPFIPSPSAPFIEPSVPVTSLTMPTAKHTVNKTYPGLPPFYTDTQDGHIELGFLAPYYMAGVIRDTSDAYQNVDDYGIFNLTDGEADAEIAAIAKASVYFKRPNDLAYFARDDGQEEYGSAFNPYWQARLVETTNGDRMISAAIQQKQVMDTTLAGLANINLNNLNPFNWLP